MRPKGHIRDARRPIGATPHARLIGGPAWVQATVMLEDEPDDQGEYLACTGFGYHAGAGKCFLRSNGHPDAPLISARAGYGGGRAKMLGNADTPLTDSGCDPASVIEFGRTYGMIPESWMPYSEMATRVNERIPPADLIGAARFGLAAFSIIEDEGDSLIGAILAAIASRCPVSFAMEVDDAYEGLTGATVYRAKTGDSRGSHAQRISGYRRVDDGHVFRVTGSWGTGFADGGFAWVHSDFIRSPYTFDFYVTTYAPLAA